MRGASAIASSMVLGGLCTFRIHILHLASSTWGSVGVCKLWSAPRSNPKPQTPKPKTPNPKPKTLDTTLKPQTLKAFSPKPQTLNPKLKTLNPKGLQP